MTEKTYTADEVDAMIARAVAAEREACAKVCEDMADQFHAHAMDCAAAIRAKGQS